MRVLVASLLLGLAAAHPDFSEERANADFKVSYVDTESSHRALQTAGTCGTPINLDNETSPYSGTTSGRGNDHRLTCGGDGPEIVFSKTVAAGGTLSIGQTTNSFDSRHELSWGGCAGPPGGTSVVCRDDSDTTNESWTNDTGAQQTAYFTIDAYTTGSGTFTLAWECSNCGAGASAGTCATPVALDGMASPISGSTTGAGNNFNLSCGGNGPEAVFSHQVAPGATIRIGQTTNTFDSRHELTWGACGAAGTSVICRDDSDTTEESWTNDTGSTQTAFFIIDAFSSSSGDFELAWTIEAPAGPTGGTCAQPIALDNETAPYSGSTANRENNFALSCGGNGNEVVFSHVVAAGASISIGQTVNTFDSRHELVYGGCGVDLGGTSVACRDDSDTTTEEWTNDTGTSQTVYFIIDAFTTGSGDFTLDWTYTAPQGNCQLATDLTTLTSPYSGTTGGRTNDIALSCGGSGPEMVFFMDVEPGATLSIGQASNTFDSRHQLSYGAECPGENVVQCRDDSDTTTESWTNDTGSVQRAYFSIDAYSTGSGDFVLAWDYSAPAGNCGNAVDLTTLTSPYSGTTADRSNDFALSCGGSGPEIVFFVEVGAGSTINIGQTENSFDSRHQIGYGAECPGENVVACRDDSDTTVEEWTNDTGAPQTVYFTIDAYSTGSGSFTLAWEVTSPQTNCVNAVDLSALESPYSGTTEGRTNEFALSCGGSGPEMVFYYDLAAGSSIAIGQTENSYDSRHQLSYGATCPGETVVICRDDSDTTTENWTNDTGALQRVYFTIDAFSSSSGTFTLAWTVSTPRLAASIDGDGFLRYGAGFVCDDGFDENDALVACREITGSATAVWTDFSQSAVLPTGDNFSLDDLACMGVEAALADCAGRFGSDNCSIGEGVSLTCGEATSSNCADVIPLEGLSSPYSDTTTGRANDLTLSCGGSGSEIVFSIQVAAGESLSIGQTENSFDSRHQLSYGETCPGENVVQCRDDSDTTTEAWTNDTGASQTVYFTIDAFSTGSGDFTLAWEYSGSSGGTCASPIPLDTIVSPYSGTTTGRENVFNLSCGGNGPEIVFSKEVAPGATLSIGQASNTFDSRHQLSYGAECPGETVVICRDDSDTTTETWTNDTGSPQTAYFTIDAYSTTPGDFTLAWTYEEPQGNCSDAIDLNSITSPYSGTTGGRTNDFALSCGGSGAEMVFYMDVADGGTLSIGQTENEFDSRHQLSYSVDGSGCPGEIVVICRDDSDTTTEEWTNDTGSSKRVYFTVDAFTSGEGTFTLAWEYTSGASASLTEEGYLRYGGGYVCDDFFDEQAARVVCRELGLPYGYYEVSVDLPAGAGDNMTMDNVECEGTEPTLGACPFTTLENCGDGEGVRVVCEAQQTNCPGAIALEGETSPYSGTTEGRADDFALECGGSGPEIVFSHVVAPGATLSIGQTENSYDSRHQLSYGTCGEGGTVVQCRDDSDTTTESWTNDTGASQTVYFTIDAFSTGSGTFTLAWEYSGGGNCSNAMDLASLASPYSGTTTGRGNDLALSCGGNGPEIVFYMDLQAGQSIDIGQTENSFDSRHQLAYGGACPGENVLQCRDDSDTTTESWSNDTGSLQRVYFSIDAFSTGSGDFTLAWAVQMPGAGPVSLSVPEGFLMVGDGYVCDDLFDGDDATVVCRELGLELVSYQTSVTLPEDNFSADDLECIGTEATVAECTARFGSDNCSAGEGVSVVCGGGPGSCSNPIALEGQQSPYSGTTEGRPNLQALTCGGNGPEVVFSHEVAPGGSLTIGQTVNSFDSRHELSYGACGPEGTSLFCRDDSDTTTEEWTNDTGSPQTVYFTIDAYSTGSGTFTIEWTYEAGGNCSDINVMNLDAMTSPYTGTTEGRSNDFALSCGGSGSEQVFMTALQPGQTLNIGQTENNFDSRHELSYGGACPGEMSVICRDDSDTTEETWTNDTGAVQEVYFTIDAFSTGSGTFTLAWEKTAAGSCGEAIDLSTVTSPFQGTTSELANDFALECGGNGSEQVFFLDLAAGATINIGQTENSYDSRHQLQWGGCGANGTVVICRDDSDTQQESWTNDTGASQRVYFTIDAYSTGSGDYTLAWDTATPGSSPQAVSILSPDGTTGGTAGYLMYGDGFVCDDLFNGDDAQVVCRELGLPYTADIIGGSYSGGQTIPADLFTDFSLDDVECASTEEALSECASETQHNCSNGEGVFVTCEVAGPTGGAGTCGEPIALDGLTSPYSGSTAGRENSFALSCGGDGPEIVFSHEVAPGETISIGQTENSFDSRHELSYGACGPEGTSVTCRDDTDTTTEEWTNDTGASQTVYFTIDAFTTGSGDFTLAWEYSGPTAPAAGAGTCPDPIALDGLTSPYDGSTAGRGNIVNLSCGGNGPEIVFSHEVEAGATLTIGQTENSFDSRHELSYGECGACGVAGTCVICRDDSDTTTEEWTNDTGTAQTAYFIIDAFTDGSGDFSLAWEYTAPPANNAGTCAQPLSLENLQSPYSDTTEGRDNNFALECGGSGPEIVFSHRVAPGATLTIGQTENAYDSRHQLSYGGACPGENVVQCRDDSDTTTETWTNDTGAEQRVYFAIDSFSTGSGDFSLAWEYSGSAGNCAAVVDLAAITSPYEGTTTGRSNDFALTCGGNGSEIVFAAALQAGETISIGQTTNSYDSRHELSYGGACPGETSVACRDDPDTETETWTNDTGTAQQVYYTIDAYSTSDGTFTLEWTIEGGGNCGQAMDLSTMMSPYSGTTTGRENSIDLSCGGSGSEIVFFHDVEPGQTFSVGQTENTYDSRHQLGWGGECPGETVVICRDDSDTTTEEWTNDTDAVQRAYFTIDAFSTGSGDFTLGWEVSTPAPDQPASCLNALNLATLQSPYSDTTEGRTNDWQLMCGGNGPEIVYYIELAASATIEIGQTENSYDSRHQLSYGACGPDGTVLQCRDDSDTTMESWTNDTGDSQTVFFTIDSFSTSSGSHTISWTVTGPSSGEGTCASPMELEMMTSPYSGTTAERSNDFALSCGGNGPEIVFSYQVAPGGTLSIGQTLNSFDSRHELSYGICGASGTNGASVVCRDDSDTTTEEWTNDTGATQTVFFTIDSYTTGSGDFTLAWTYTGPDEPTTGLSLTDDNILMYGDGFVCDDGWPPVIGGAYGDQNARVACRAMGLPWTGATFETAVALPFGTFTLDDVVCEGSESSFDECSWNVEHNCSGGEAIRLNCASSQEMNVVLTPEGILMAERDGQMGYVCDDYFDENAARVVCRELGLEYVDHDTTISLPEDNFLVDDVRCTGEEARLQDCEYIGNDQENCGTTEGVSVTCSGDGALNAQLTAENILTVTNPSGQTGYVCDDRFGQQAAEVVCRELGLSTEGVTYQTSVLLPEDNFFMDDVNCGGTESRLSDCDFYDTDNCSASEGVQVFCGSGPASLRAVLSADNTLEIYQGSERGFICDDSFDQNAAEVACREMGLPWANARFETEVMVIEDRFFMDNVVCEGSELALRDCDIGQDIETEDCSVGEGVRLFCEGTTAPPTGELISREEVCEITETCTWTTQWTAAMRGQAQSINELLTRVGVLEEAGPGGEVDFSAINSQISGLTTGLGDAEDRLDALENAAPDAVDFSAIESRLETIEGNQETDDGRLNDAEARLEILEAIEIPDHSETLEQLVTDVEAALSLVDRVDAIDGPGGVVDRVDLMEATGIADEERLGALESGRIADEERLGALESGQSTLQSSVATIQAEMDAGTSQDLINMINAQQTTIDGLTDDLGEAQATIDTMGLRLAALEAEILGPPNPCDRELTRQEERDLKKCVKNTKRNKCLRNDACEWVDDACNLVCTTPQ